MLKPENGRPDADLFKNPKLKKKYMKKKLEMERISNSFMIFGLL